MESIEVKYRGWKYIYLRYATSYNIFISNNVKIFLLLISSVVVWYKITYSDRRYCNSSMWIELEVIVLN